jgi:hypothetical protein
VTLRHDRWLRPSREIRRSGGKSRAAQRPSEPNSNGRSVSPTCANTHRRITRATTAAGSDGGVGGSARKAIARVSDNGPLSRLRFPRGCVAFTVLEPVSKSQRLFQLVVGIGPPGGQFPVDLGGLLDGGQRVFLRPRSARLAERLFSELARSGRIASGWVLVGRTPPSLMLFAVAAEFKQVTARQEQWNAHRRQRTGSWSPAL